MRLAVQSILVVCMGNICRSPLGQGIFEARSRDAGLRLRVDSAGTHAYHVGERPHPRSIAVARSRGIEIGGQRARLVEADDFRRFDVVLAADRQNLAHLQRLRPSDASAELALLLEWCGLGAIEVPDPYYDDDTAFIAVFDLLDGAATGLLRRLAKPA